MCQNRAQIGGEDLVIFLCDMFPQLIQSILKPLQISTHILFQNFHPTLIQRRNTFSIFFLEKHRFNNTKLRFYKNSIVVCCLN